MGSKVPEYVRKIENDKYWLKLVCCCVVVVAVVVVVVVVVVVSFL
jgi:hypothetical protein